MCPSQGTRKRTTAFGSDGRASLPLYKVSPRRVPPAGRQDTLPTQSGKNHQWSDTLTAAFAPPPKSNTANNTQRSDMLTEAAAFAPSYTRQNYQSHKLSTVTKTLSDA
ncbi:hypothetical protein NDU88_000449 [Pleurodeles waltl]|uniref:Uncharacterized protein n=1 Tax=Pleurodeles waltl TaxID=8319 RepID=A0AAV7Q1A1_PLEWA|nr:hypothetical protein NDU88_000449 [Pleurodeles waltl]